MQVYTCERVCGDEHFGFSILPSVEAHIVNFVQQSNVEMVGAIPAAQFHAFGPHKF